jgi:streptogramin lyase
MEAKNLEPGTTVGGHVVTGFIDADGGVARYRTLDPRLQREVMLRVAEAQTPAGERLLSQARTIAGVDDPRVLRLYEAGIDGSLVFAATGAVDATPLPGVLATRLLAPGEAVDIAGDAAIALTKLEAAGVPARLVSDAVVVGKRNGRLAAYVDPLASTSGRGDVLSPEALADFLRSMLGADTGPLEPVLRGASGYPSATALADAARDTLARPEPRRRAVVPLVLGAGAVLAVVVAVAATRTGEAPPPARPPATAASARVAAVIPVGGEPAAVAFGQGGVWVANRDRRLLKLDPRSGQVVGAPVRFAERHGDPRFNITVLTGQGAVFVFDYATSTAVRVDPRSRRVEIRARLRGHPDSAVLGAGELWVALNVTRAGGAESSVVQALDPETLRPSGRAVRVGADPQDIEFGGDAVFATAQGDGTVTRVDAHTHAARRVFVAAQPVNAGLVGDRLWVPDAVSGAVHVLGTDLGHPARDVLLPGPAAGVVGLSGGAWVVVNDRPQPDVPARLLRIDPASGRQIGAPLKLGRAGAWPAVGGGALWVTEGARHAVLRIVPVAPAPRPGRDLSAPRDGSAHPGPLRGRVNARVGGVRFSATAPDGEWVGVVAEPIFGGQRFHEPDVGFNVMVPKQLLEADGGVTPARDARGVIDHLRHHRGLRATAVRRVRLGGRPALQVELRARRYSGTPPFCSAACTPTIADGPVTNAVQAPSTVRVTALDVDGHPFVITEDSGRRGHGLPTTGAMVRSFRFE